MASVKSNKTTTITDLAIHRERTYVRTYLLLLGAATKLEVPAVSEGARNLSFI